MSLGRSPAGVCACFVALLAIVCCTAGEAQQEQKMTQLIVNGTAVTGPLLVKDGRIYVAVEDLARALGGSISYQGTNTLLSLPSVSPPKLKGKIRGTLTYFFNFNFKNKPDTGAEIWLVKGTLEIPESRSVIGFDGLDTIAGKDGKQHRVVYHTVADGNGNYEIPEIDPGEYTLILKSNHSNAITTRDVMGKVFTFSVTIKGGETVDKSFDFGMTET